MSQSMPDLDRSDVSPDGDDQGSGLMVGAIAGIAAMGVSMAARPVLNATYRRITGHTPPRADDLRVPFRKALVWTIVSATTGAVLELVVQRTARRLFS